MLPCPCGHHRLAITVTSPQYWDHRPILTVAPPQYWDHRPTISATSPQYWYHRPIIVPVLFSFVNLSKPSHYPNLVISEESHLRKCLHWVGLWVHL